MDWKIFPRGEAKVLCPECTPNFPGLFPLIYIASYMKPATTMHTVSNERIFLANVEQTRTVAKNKQESRKISEFPNFLE